MQIEATPQRQTARRQLARRGVAILYEDNHLIGCAKPAGLLSQRGPRGAVALTDLLETYRKVAEGKPGRAYVGLVHRLDRNVSGALVVARTSKAAARLSTLFRERAPDLLKRYLAWVRGVPDGRDGVLVDRVRREEGVTRVVAEEDEDAREARLSWRRAGVGREVARVEIRLETGLPHQIRAQWAHAGHPVLGDRKYGGPPAARLALHAATLAFPHPVADDLVTLHAQVPDDLRRLDAEHGVQPPVG